MRKPPKMRLVCGGFLPECDHVLVQDSERIRKWINMLVKCSKGQELLKKSNEMEFNFV